MNKNKIVMCSIGGVTLVAALVLGWLIWSAFEEKTEKLDDLETAKANVKRINSSKISPEQASVDALEENRRILAMWKDEVFALVAQGDIAPKPEQAAAFKATLTDEARAEASKPGGVAGKIVKDEFEFGFKDLITGGRIPEEAQVPVLQRQWSDIKLFTDTLSDCGAIELQEVVIVPPKAAEPRQEAGPRRGPKGRRGAKEEEKKPLAAEQNYEIKFTARPLALVKIVNALATCKRFVTIDSMNFRRVEDTLAVALGEKGAEGARGGGRGHGGRRPARMQMSEMAAGQDGAEETARKKGLVIDPATDQPFAVTMKLTVYDFGTAGGEKPEDADEKKEEVEE